MGLAGHPAAELAGRVRRREITAVEVVAAHLDAVDGTAHLNAFILVDRNRSLEQARRIDLRIAAGDDPGPLSGVPVALKDLVDQAGLTTTCGSGFYRQIPERSAMLVDRIEAADGIVIGRAGLHEFAFGFNSENEWFGPIHNPWERGTSPGGSSGGSAASVAAGSAALAVGTDTGGSIRVPAALCGVVGLKPTHGRVPMAGVFPLAPSLDTAGPLARSVADAGLLYAVMSGDGLSHPPPDPVPPGVGSSLAGLRIGVPAAWLETAMDTETRLGFEWALERMGDLGATVRRVPAPGLRPSAMITASMGPEIAAVHRRWFPAHRGQYGKEVADRLDRAFAVGDEEQRDALAWRASLRIEFAGLLTAHDVLATPTVPALRKEMGRDDVGTESGPVPHVEALSWFTSLVNHAGLPALAVPLACAGTPPPSLQLIGPAGGEARLLGIGVGLEEAGVSGFRAPPPP